MVSEEGKGQKWEGERKVQVQDLGAWAADRGAGTGVSACEPTSLQGTELQEVTPRWCHSGQGAQRQGRPLPT